MAEADTVRLESKGDEGGGSAFAFGAYQEVGGRPYQEDGFITEANLNLKFELPHGTSRALFAVLDGHGGDEMMEFAQEVHVCVWRGGGVGGNVGGVAGLS